MIVLVLGDVGRSPRMQYHALSLAQSEAARVFLVGYVGERCVPAVEAQGSKIVHIRLSADLLPRPKARALYLVYAPLKAILQLAQLLWTLLVRLPVPAVLLVQNPPAIPTLAAAFVARALRGGAVVVDWHNLGFSVLQHSLREGHPFVRWSMVYERFFGRRLDGHLCVTHAMGRWLEDEWGVAARVLHDRPPSFFRRLSIAERHGLLRRLAPQFVDASGAPVWPLEGASAAAEGGGGGGGASPWDDGGTPWSSSPEVERPDKPRLLVSSTSWTADEDFGILLDALRALDGMLDATSAAASSARSIGPRVVAVITGKGPLKEHYRGLMRAMQLRHVAVCTMWLEPSDYPALLGSADLGVSLHTSTSGLDLPMKVLDMYGCGLPVCAMGFACLNELVRDGENGRVFRTSEELAEQLVALLAPSPSASAALAQLREGVVAAEAGRPRWAQNWSAAAAPLLVPSRDDGKRRGILRFALGMLCFVTILWLYLQV